MLTISVHHPQIHDFIKIKGNLKRLTGANISVRLSDEFLEAVRYLHDIQDLGSENAEDSESYLGLGHSD